MKNSFLKILIVFAVYLIIAVIFTYPLANELNSSFPGDGGQDSFEYAWNIQTFWYQLEHHQNPFFTNRIFYPIGANLVFNDYSPLTSLILGAFRSNIVADMNSAILLGLCANAFAMLILIRYLVKNFNLSVVGGLLYGFSPVMISFVVSQHYYYIWAAIYLPLEVYILLRYFDSRKILEIYKVILLFWLCFFTNYYVSIMYLIILVIIVSVRLIYYLFVDKQLFFWFFQKKQLFGYSMALVTCVLIPALILFVNVFSLRDFNQWQSGDNILHYECNTNLLGFFIPSSVGFQGSIATYLYNLFGFLPSTDTPSFYLGISFMILAFVVMKVSRKNVNRLTFIVIGVFFLVFSLGSRVYFGHIVIVQGVWTPFYWFTKIPYLNLVDCPVKFSIAVQLAFVLLIMMGLGTLVQLKYFSSFKISVFVFLLFILEYGGINIPITKVYIPKVYQQISGYKDSYTILEIPSGLVESKGEFGDDYSMPGLNTKQMYWQTIYQKPRIGGYISRVSPNTYHFFETKPIISDLFRMTSYQGMWSGRIYTISEVKRFLSNFNIGYIILSPEEKQQYYNLVINNLLLGVPHQEFYSEGYILYKLK